MALHRFPKKGRVHGNERLNSYLSSPRLKVGAGKPREARGKRKDDNDPHETRDDRSRVETSTAETRHKRWSQGLAMWHTFWSRLDSTENSAEKGQLDLRNLTRPNEISSLASASFTTCLTTSLVFICNSSSTRRFSAFFASTLLPSTGYVFRGCQERTLVDSLYSLRNSNERFLVSLCGSPRDVAEVYSNANVPSTKNRDYRPAQFHETDTDSLRFSHLFNQSWNWDRSVMS